MLPGERGNSIQSNERNKQIITLKGVLKVFIVLTICTLLFIIADCFDKRQWHQLKEFSQTIVPSWKSFLATVSIFSNSFTSHADEKLKNKGFSNADINSVPVHEPSVGCRSIINDNEKFDCWPQYYVASRSKCEMRGCCWNGSSPSNVPVCYFPRGYPGYRIQESITHDKGSSLFLRRDSKSPWPDDIVKLKIDIIYESSDCLHIKIFDPTKKRYEVPIPTVHSKGTTSQKFIVTIKNNSASFDLFVQRTDHTTIFNTSGIAPLIFSDQYIQLTTMLSSHYVYGLGEHRGGFLQDLNWKKLVFWARDQPPVRDANLYGSHPFLLNIETDGRAHGIFMLNSNAMEIDLQPTPALTYRTTGGIIDMYVFSGPTPDDVINQYMDVIGRPFMPPYWGLGFHLCRWGYGGSAGLKAVIKRMRDAKMPYDTQWNDIDYMTKHLDWTYDKENYKELPQIINDLHENGQHYIMIVDPGISNTQTPGTYPPYDIGLKNGVFIMGSNGSQPIIGKVWPGETAFVDFFNPHTVDYWFQVAKNFHETSLKFDGLWTDMNEPSNFVDGSTTGCEENSLNIPPFTPPNLSGRLLMSKTLCPSSKQYVSHHYNLHNLYGHSEANITHRILRKILKKRSLVISRSTFPSTGTVAGHWLGDNNAKWDDLYYSIPGILNFNMFGIPLVGADICGFNGNTSQELCIRWMQLGIFYPFMRNHNTIGAKDQDPACFDKDAQDIMREALNLRYTLIPYLYTQFFRIIKMKQSTIVKPLFFRYGATENTLYSIDKQFMWGEEFLVTPVLQQGATNVLAFIPNDTWYDGYNLTKLRHVGQSVVVDAPLGKIPHFIRGETILLTQPAGPTTTFTRRQNFSILVAPGSSQKANGDLFLDDGESLDTIEKGNYTYIVFTYNQNLLQSSVVEDKYRPKNPPILNDAKVLNVEAEPVSVTLNGNAVPFKYRRETHILELSDLKIDLLKEFKIMWSYHL